MEHGIIQPKRTTLRIVVWNCAQAFHTKYQHLIDQLDPDVAIISECAHPDILLKRKVPLAPGTYDWFGENLQKGLGVFTFHDYRIPVPAGGDLAYKWILPVSITGPQNFNLIAVWARYHEAKRSGASGPVLDFLERQKKRFLKHPTVIAGDFNSSVKFKSDLRRHEKIVDALAERGFASAYHRFYDVAQGEEIHPTIYWRDKKKDGKFNYHIDYCFIPNEWSPALRTVSVGTFEAWVLEKKGDHVPMLIEIDLTRLRCKTFVEPSTTPSTKDDPD